MSNIPISFLKGEKMGVETDYRDSLPQNMIGIPKPILGADGYMLQTPGLTKYGQGVGIDRRGVWNERHAEHYRVSGNKLIKVDAAGVQTSLGAISGLGTASLPYSFNTQCVIADGRMWLYDSGAGFVEVVDANLGDPIDGVWIDGYYFMTDGEYVFHTDITNEAAIDPLKFATAEFSPDPTLGVGKTLDNKAIAFGRYTTEYFRNIASPNFAFTRLSSRALRMGIVGTHCKAQMLDMWFIMGGRKEENVSIHVLGGEKIASREIDKIIAQYTEDQLSISVLETWTENDYHYLIVHLPNETLLFNLDLAKKVGTGNAWSIRKSEDNTWRGKFGLFEPRLGKWVYGDKIDGTLGLLDNTNATDYGKINEWTLSTPFMKLESLSIDALEIESIPGHTVTDDATVFVSLTYEGMTHGLEWTKAYGSPSEYGHRFILNRLGYVNNWVGIKLRGRSRSRMAFSKAGIDAS